MRHTLALVALLFISACSGDATKVVVPARPNVSGTWSGNVGTGTMTLTMVHDTLSGSVNGSGSIASPGLSITVTAQGTYVAPTLSLILSSPGYQPMNFTGLHAGTSITGTINGSGFNNAGSILTKR